MSYRILQGDASTVLRGLPAESVHCVVTSPPYWGLRDYKLEPLVWGGEAGCGHEWKEETVNRELRTGLGLAALGERLGTGGGHKQGKLGWVSATRGTCLLCGAWRRSLGLEPTPELYVQHLVEIFREVRRVLRRDGTLWLNLGDSYASQGGSGRQGQDGQTANRTACQPGGARERRSSSNPPPGLKPKDLIGIPWRVAFALQTDGWWLRRDIIWHKPNPMPESCEDRCTTSHEYIFHLSKSGDTLLWRHKRTLEWVYSEPAPDYVWRDRANGNAEQTVEAPDWRTELMADGRKRWSRINLWRGFDYYYDAEAIKEPFSTDPKENYPARARITGRGTQGAAEARGNDQDKSGGFPPNGSGRNRRSVWTVSTYPVKEAHFATYPPDLIEPCILAGCIEGGTVLDPFAGSGTTGLAAIKHGRKFLGIELSPEYIKIAEKRLNEHFSLFAGSPCST